MCVYIFIHRFTQARGQCHCLLGTTCFLEGFQGRGNACFSTRAHPKQVPFFISMLWCFAWSVPFHRRCAEECTTNTPLLWHSCSKVSHLKGTADVCASSTSSFMELSGGSFCLLQFPLLLPAFQFQASTAASLGSSLGLLSVTYTILELVDTTTTTLLCNLFIKSKSSAVSSNCSSAYTRLLHSTGAISVHTHRLVSSVFLLQQKPEQKSYSGSRPQRPLNLLNQPARQLSR